jgi:predicted DNA binding protein
MSVYGEFYVPTEEFAFHEALQELPETTLEIERVVATEEVLTPYFWVNGSDFETFMTVSESDPTVQNVRQLDEFERAALFRADWTVDVDTIIHAYTQVGATILEATGQYDEWKLSMRFDEYSDLQQFQAHCNEQAVQFRCTRLHELTQPRTGSRYGLTPKQHDALVTAWEMEYFTSGDVTLRDVAVELGITPQSLSGLLHRGHRTLIEQTLAVTSP